MISINNLFLLDEDSPPWREDSRFIIHEHHAEKAGLHYDLRIEYNNKLKSWATRKLPEIAKGNKNKIALFKQPDHELDWYDWKGTIEDGYGKGEVKIWDKGEIEILKWLPKKKIVDFKGRRIKGKYAIIFYEKDQHLMVKMK